MATTGHPDVRRGRRPCLRGLTASLVAVAMSALAAPTPAAALRTQDPELEQAVLAVLKEASSASRERRAELELELGGLGSRAFPLLLRSLARERLPDGFGTGGLDTRQLVPAQSETLEGALARMPRESLRAGLRALPGGPESLPERSAGLRLLGRVGAREDVLLLTRLANPGPGERSVDRSLRAVYESALEDVLAREPAGLREVASAFGQAHPSLLAHLIGAAGTVRSPEALGALAGLLGRVPEADPLLLIELGRVGAEVAHPVDERVLAMVRRYLDSGEPRVVVETALVCASLEDGLAAERLVALVADPRPGVGPASRKALVQLTGRDVGDGAAAWQAWYREQSAWWEQQSKLELRLLADGPPVEVARILKDLVQRTHHRHEVAPKVAAVLRRPEVDLVALACAVLGHLRSPLAVPQLVEALEHPDARVRREAHRALLKTTGQKLPPDAAQWRTWIGP